MIAIYILFAVVGMIGHWLKKWAREEINCSLLDYIKGEKRHTVGALLTVIAATLYAMADVTVLSQADVIKALLIGFAGDSLANKAPEEIV